MPAIEDDSSHEYFRIREQAQDTDGFIREIRSVYKAVSYTHLKDTYERAKTAFATEADSLETQTEYISQTLQNVFDFMEAAFGDSQEMVAFITELNANFFSIWFLSLIHIFSGRNTEDHFRTDKRNNRCR